MKEHEVLIGGVRFIGHVARLSVGRDRCRLRIQQNGFAPEHLLHTADAQIELKSARAGSCRDKRSAPAAGLCFPGLHQNDALIVGGEAAQKRGRNGTPRQDVKTLAHWTRFEAELVHANNSCNWSGVKPV